MPIDPNVHTVDKEVNLLTLTAYLKELSGQHVTRNDRPSKKGLKERLADIHAEGSVLDVTSLGSKGKGASKTKFSENGQKVRLEKRKNSILYSVVYNKSKPQSVEGVTNLLTLLGHSDSQIQKYVESVATSLDLSPSARAGKVRTPLSRSPPPKKETKTKKTTGKTTSKAKKVKTPTVTAKNARTPSPTPGKAVKSPRSPRSGRQTQEELLENLLA